VQIVNFLKKNGLYTLGHLDSFKKEHIKAYGMNEEIVLTRI